MDNLLSWIPTIIALGVFILSVVKSKSERSNMNGGTLKLYMETAKIAGEDAKAAREESSQANRRVEELETELESFKDGREYMITILLKVGGDKPIVGDITVEPITIKARNNNSRKKGV
jgi:hypothetical protein